LGLAGDVSIGASKENRRRDTRQSHVGGCESPRPR